MLWRHVPTTEDAADLGIRGGSVTAAELWYNGPTWLADPSKWPPQFATNASEISDGERKVQQELSVVGVEVSNYLDTILSKFGLRKATRFFGGLAVHPSFSKSFQEDGWSDDN